MLMDFRPRRPVPGQRALASVVSPRELVKIQLTTEYCPFGENAIEQPNPHYRPEFDLSLDALQVHVLMSALGYQPALDGTYEVEAEGFLVANEDWLLGQDPADLRDPDPDTWVAITLRIVALTLAGMQRRATHIRIAPQSYAD